MAKRRNLKKEKALRNQAYARKFRKRGGNRYGRRFNNNKPESENENTENKSDDKEKDASASGAATASD